MSLITENFHFYHPYLTFSDTGNSQFISLRGTACGELTVDTGSLFNIAKNAYEYLKVKDESEFDTRHKEWISFIQDLRGNLKDEVESGNLNITNESGKVIHINFEKISISEILNIYYGYTEHLLNQENRLISFLSDAYLFLSLWEVDNALIALSLESDEVVVASVEATLALSTALSLNQGEEKEQQARRNLAYKAAMARVKNDPRIGEKSFIQECWEDWQESPKKYKSKAAFARDMLTKVEYLQSQKKIEDWCREWSKKKASSKQG